MREPARSDAQARRRYLRHLNRATQCVAANAVWRAGESETAGVWTAVTAPPTLILGTSAGHPLYVRCTQTFHFANHPDFPGERKVRTEDYAYTIAEDDELRSELASWHWQPDRGHPHPHLHVGFAHPRYTGSPRWHLPTGRVALEEVVAFSIRERNVKPAVDEWEATLGDTLARFRRFRTWS